MSIQKKQPALKSLSDQSLEGLLRCPYQYYHQQVLGQFRTFLNWKQLVQRSIHRVVQAYYQLPVTARTPEQVLQLIQAHWSDQMQAFDSKEHFLMVLANVSNHLVQALETARQDAPPLFLYEDQKVWMEELQLELVLSFHVAEWTETSFRIRKYTVEEQGESFEAFRHMAIAFSHRAFGRVPEEIEMVSLLSGRTHRARPTEADVANALQYLQLMPSMFTDDYYQVKTTSTDECRRCPFHSTCRAGHEQDALLQP